jgi:hypothetical protein
LHMKIIKFLLYQKSKYEIKQKKNPISWYRADRQKSKTELVDSPRVAAAGM